MGRTNQTTPPRARQRQRCFTALAPPLCSSGREKPANMAAPCFLTLRVATLAALALLSLGSSAAGHIEVGIGVC